MNQLYETPVLEGVHLQSTEEELDAAMHRAGMFQYSHEYLKDRHFQRYVLPIGIRTMDNVHQFLEKLDADNRGLSNATGCHKVSVARSSLAYQHGPTIDPMDWAISSLARARRTCCGCHHTGSFAVSERVKTGITL